MSTSLRDASLRDSCFTPFLHLLKTRRRLRGRVAASLLVACLLVLGLAAVPGAAQAQIYVDAGNTSGTEDGASWGTAFTDLQDALSIATGTDEIWIAAGTYTPTRQLDAGDARTATFEITGAQDGLGIYGGFAGTETARSERAPIANEVILSGDIGTAGDASDNAYHVLVFNGGDGIGTNSPENITPGTVLDGLTITGGNANGGFSNSTNAGGGLYCDGESSGNACSPSLTRLTFTGNSADLGGAIYNRSINGGTSSPQVTNAIFTGNSASSGGAIYNNGSFSGTSSPVITNATFTGNSASSRGGALYNNGSFSGTSSPQVTNAIFTGNSASSGGALHFRGDGGTIAAQIINSVFASNGADHVGFDDGNAGEQPRFVHSTFTGATDFAFDVRFYDSGQTPLEVVGSVLWDNGPGGIAGSASVTDPDAAVAVTFSIVEEARYAAGSSDANAGPGNINQTPLFVDASAPAGPDGILGTADDGLRLEPGSPALNAGDNSVIPSGITTDFIGEDRIQCGQSRGLRAGQLHRGSALLCEQKCFRRRRILVCEGAFRSAIRTGCRYGGRCDSHRSRYLPAQRPAQCQRPPHGYV